MESADMAYRLASINYELCDNGLKCFLFWLQKLPIIKCLECAKNFPSCSLCDLIIIITKVCHNPISIKGKIEADFVQLNLLVKAVQKMNLTPLTSKSCGVNCCATLLLISVPTERMYIRSWFCFQNSQHRANMLVTHKRAGE